LWDCFGDGELDHNCSVGFNLGSEGSRYDSKIGPVDEVSHLNLVGVDLKRLEIDGHLCFSESSVEEDSYNSEAVILNLNGPNFLVTFLKNS
jgi:hypothetical protein